MTEEKSVNPAGAEPVRRRIPMSTPQRRLEAPDLPGYHCHWFVNRNVARALQGGYDPVTVDEFPNMSEDIRLARGMGNNVELVDGSTDERGQTVTLHLMKIKLEWWREDQRNLEQRNANVLEAIFKGEKIMGQEAPTEDNSLSYVNRDLTGFQRASKPLFLRPPRKG